MQSIASRAKTAAPMSIAMRVCTGAVRMGARKASEPRSRGMRSCIVIGTGRKSASTMAAPRPNCTTRAWP